MRQSQYPDRHDDGPPPHTPQWSPDSDHTTSPDSDHTASPDDTGSELQPRASFAPRWSRWGTILATFALVLGPLAYLGLPDEISRWYIAAAIEAQRDGDTSKALERMADARRWAPENPAIPVYRGDWKRDAGDFEGSLVEYERALQIDATNRWALMNRSVSLQHLGRHAEAIADWKRLLASDGAAFPAIRAVNLNGLAYAQAVGNTELDDALENVEQALRTVGQNAAMLDTRGFIQYRRGDLKSARADLDLAVKLIEEQYAQASNSTQYTRRREFEAGLNELARSVAVLRYHRALVYEAMGRSERAAKDLARVRELGFEPGEHLF
jgi:tetratricopeptide (TPR) repeat protein